MADPIAGKRGTITVSSSELYHVRNWSFTPTNSVPGWVSNQTAGYVDRVEGTNDGSGSFMANVDPGGTVPVRKGQKVTLKLCQNTEVDVNYITVPAIIASVAHGVDNDSGIVVSYTASFNTCGAWSGAGCFANV